MPSLLAYILREFCTANVFAGLGESSTYVAILNRYSIVLAMQSSDPEPKSQPNQIGTGAVLKIYLSNSVCSDVICAQCETLCTSMTSPSTGQNVLQTTNRHE